MKRIERNEYNSIKKWLKQFKPGYTMTVTIRTDGGSEYKHALHEHYMSLGFHPASVRVDKHFYDEKERIIYIFGQSFELNGAMHPWTELYTAEELERFRAALDWDAAMGYKGGTMPPLYFFAPYVSPR